MAAVAAVAAFAAVAHLAVPMMASDWRAKGVLVDQDLWESGAEPWSVEQWERAEQTLLRSLADTPTDAVLMDALGRLCALRGSEAWTGGQPGSPELAWYTKALEWQKRSIAVRPGFATSWANRALYESALGLPTEVWLASWEKARALGPNEITVRQTLQSLAIRHWEQIPESVQTWTQTTDPAWEEKLTERARASAAPASTAESDGAEESARRNQ